MGLTSFAIPGVGVCIISFLSYGSQGLFYFIEPGPLQGVDFYTFNALMVCIWAGFAQACLADPGTIPKNWQQSDAARKENPARWCKKCDAPKPPRAHHCKVCKKCIPKMDHHCPWTANCVSHRTFPHFLRFLFWSVITMTQLAGFHFTRLSIIWDDRNLPSYLGPSKFALAMLFILLAANCLTLFGVGILCIRTVWCLATNVTAVESWEIERHAVLARRARKYGGYLEGADGSRVRLVKQEFPFDIGIYANMRQGMNGSPLIWLLPFAATPTSESGLEFETNGFNEPGQTWPPPDPDRLPRASRAADMSEVALELDDRVSDQERLKAFKERQQADLRRRTTRPETWRNSEGEALNDFGVDEETELGDDDVPLAELLRRREMLKTTC